MMYTFETLRLHYNIAETNDIYYITRNQQDYEKMKDKLHKAGVKLKIENGVLSLSLDVDTFNSVVQRNAGRRKKIVTKENETEVLHGYELPKPWRYADVVKLMQTMTNKDIAAKIGMPYATYMRHKKILINSDYYKSLDKNRLEDIKYLNSVEMNRIF